MANYKPPGVGEERVSKVQGKSGYLRMLVNPRTLKVALRFLDVVQLLCKVVAKLLELVG